MPQSYYVTFIADDAFIDLLKAYAAEHPDHLTVQSETEEGDASRSALELEKKSGLLQTLP